MHIYNIKINGSKTFKIIATIISIAVICLFIYSIFLVYNLSNSEKNGSTDGLSNAAISEENYTNILKSVHENLDDYIGQKITFTGYVYRVYDFDENNFVLARDMIISSDMQTVVVGFLCESNKAKNFSDGTWVTVEGEITKGEYHGELPIIKVKNIEECKNPDKKNVYPPDETYIETNNI